MAFEAPVWSLPSARHVPGWRTRGTRPHHPTVLGRDASQWFRSGEPRPLAKHLRHKIKLQKMASTTFLLFWLNFSTCKVDMIAAFHWGWPIFTKFGRQHFIGQSGTIKINRNGHTFSMNLCSMTVFHTTFMGLYEGFMLTKIETTFYLVKQKIPQKHYYVWHCSVLHVWPDSGI